MMKPSSASVLHLSISSSQVTFEKVLLCALLRCIMTYIHTHTHTHTFRPVFMTITSGHHDLVPHHMPCYSHTLVFFGNTGKTTHAACKIKVSALRRALDPKIRMQEH
jgi:hypothetical protein